MNERALLLCLVAAAAFPVSASAGGAMTQAGAVSRDGGKFDGSVARGEGDAVRAGGRSDKRTAEQIAKDEQVKADARDRANLTARTGGPDKEIEPPKPSTWYSIPLAQKALCGAVVGLLIGSLFGPIGLILGPLLGAGLYYGLARHAAAKAAAEGD